MCRTTHIFLCGLIYLGIFENGNTAEHPVITPSLLSTLSANVGAVLSPSLLKEIQNRASNRTLKENHESFYNEPAPYPPSASKPKPTRLTSKKPKLAPIPNSQLTGETDNLRAPQTQLENQFPYDPRNNFRDFGTGFQGAGRQLSGQFNNQGQFGQFNGLGGGVGGFGGDPFSSDIYRPFAALDGSRANDNGAQPQQQQFAGQGNQNNGNRQFNFPGNPQDFNRFQDFGRFGFNGQFPGQNRFFDPSQRQNQFLNFQQDPRLAQNQQNFQDPRLNYQNSDGRQVGPNGVGPNGVFQQQNFGNLPQNYAPNFNLAQNQRFQSPFNGNFNGNEQDGLNPNFPYFQNRPDAPQPQQIPNNGQNINSPNSSRRSEDSPQRKAQTQKTTTVVPEVESLQIEKLFYPPVNDYSDVRINSEHTVGANVVDKNPKTNIV